MKNQNLNSKVISATKWAGITEIAAKLVAPVTTMVLARLLTPDAFGVLVTAQMVISFAEIFEYIVGISSAENHKNVFRDVYRVERHSDSDVAYMSSDNSDMEIEPFSYERAAIYNIAKENSRRSESGIMHKDSLADNNIRTFKNINLGDLQMVAETKDIKTLKQNIKEISKCFLEQADEFAEDIRNTNFTEVRVILQPQRIPAIIIKTTRPEVKNG